MVAQLHLVVSDKAVSFQIEIVFPDLVPASPPGRYSFALVNCRKRLSVAAPPTTSVKPRRRPNRQPGFTRAFVGLWCDAKGDCQRAHESTQDEGRAAGHSSAPDREDMIISVWTGIVCERDHERSILSSTKIYDVSASLVGAG